jgi:hypothetical protein
MNFEYGFACAFASFLGSFIGNLVKNKIINDTKKLSFLVYILGIIFCFTTISIPLQALFYILKDLDNGKNIFEFKYPCN